MPVERLGENFLNPDDVDDGDVLTITQKPELVTTQWKHQDGTPKKRYRISVELPNGEEKPITLNNTSSNALLEVFTSEEKDWLDKQIVVEKRFQKVRGEDKYVLYFKAKDATRQGKLPENAKLTMDQARERFKDFPKDLQDALIDKLRSEDRLVEGP